LQLKKFDHTSGSKMLHKIQFAQTHTLQTVIVQARDTDTGNSEDDLLF